jgi:hypothetical protein
VADRPGTAGRGTGGETEAHLDEGYGRAGALGSRL